MPQYKFFGQQEVFENVTVSVEADSEEEARAILDDENEHWAFHDKVSILWEETEAATDQGFTWERAEMD